MAKNGNVHPTRIFKSPEELNNAFQDYKEDVKKQSGEWLKVQFVGKDGDRKAEPQKVPLTLEGFYRYCYSNHGSASHYFENSNNYYADFGGGLFAYTDRNQGKPDHRRHAGFLQSFNHSKA